MRPSSSSVSSSPQRPTSAAVGGSLDFANFEDNSSAVPSQHRVPSAAESLFAPVSDNNNDYDDSGFEFPAAQPATTQSQPQFDPGFDGFDLPPARSSFSASTSSSSSFAASSGAYTAQFDSFDAAPAASSSFAAAPSAGASGGGLSCQHTHTPS
jgi:hypothetical protein